jgi:hypothetical protein
VTILSITQSSSSPVEHAGASVVADPAQERRGACARQVQRAQTIASTGRIFRHHGSAERASVPGDHGRRSSPALIRRRRSSRSRSRSTACAPRSRSSPGRRPPTRHRVTAAPRPCAVGGAGGCVPDRYERGIDGHPGWGRTTRCRRRDERGDAPPPNVIPRMSLGIDGSAWWADAARDRQMCRVASCEWVRQGWPSPGRRIDCRAPRRAAILSPSEAWSARGPDPGRRHR